MFQANIYVWHHPSKLYLNISKGENLYTYNLFWPLKGHYQPKQAQDLHIQASGHLEVVSLVRNQVTQPTREQEENITKKIY